MPTKIGGKQTLSQVLSRGNTTGNGQIIKSLNGDCVLDLRAFNIGDNFFLLGNSGNLISGALDKAHVFGSELVLSIGFTSIFSTKYTDKSTELKGGAGNFVTLIRGVVGIYDNGDYIGLNNGIIIVESLVDRPMNADQGAGIGINTGNASNSTYKKDVLRSVIIGGEGLTAKTDETVYINQLSFQESGVLFDCILKSITATADREHELQDSSGTLAHLADIVPLSCGNMYVSTAIETSVVTVNTPIKMAGTFTAEHLANFDMPVNGRMRYIGSVTKVVNCMISMTIINASNNINFSFYIAKNGSVLSQTKQQRKLAGGSDIGAVSIVGAVEVSTNDYIEIFCENNTDSTNVTAVNMYVNIL